MIFDFNCVCVGRSAHTLQAPKPFVNDTLARHRTVGDDFQLDCSATYPIAVHVKLEWQIPHPQGIDVTEGNSNYFKDILTNELI